MPISIPGAPPPVVAALERLKDELSRTAGPNLAGLILYGGLARGRYRPGKSDVNIVVLLNDISAVTLAAIAPALRSARRAAGVSPLILTPAEVRPAAAVFPIKFLDIKDRHIVLHGADPFAQLDVPRQQIALRIAQELRNLTLRLRRRFVAIWTDRNLQTATLANLARPLAIELAAMLRLAGKDVPAEDRTAAIFQTAAVAFGIDGEVLARLAAIRQGEPAGDDPQALLSRILTVLTKLTETAERMKESPT